MSDDDFRELLKQHRLENFTEKLIGIGVTCQADLENVEAENLAEMGKYSPRGHLI